LIEGGGHERNLRSGTPDVPAIVGFGCAASVAAQCLDEDQQRIGALRDALQASILAAHSNATINGDQDRRVPHILNITIPTQNPEPLLAQLPGVACSSGAACASAKDEPSHVLAAIGLTPEAAASTIRLSLGRSTTSDHVAIASEALQELAD
ncbi:MAG: aminotransferase class V-fold PLP-dependent enzyme, partial [Phycisphaerales bacterium]|nr:aminotransferase class V-fold PLP-dependent enzyme [Phycisphaerales bacterium]